MTSCLYVFRGHIAQCHSNAFPFSAYSLKKNKKISKVSALLYFMDSHYIEIFFFEK
jgi:hypothetical protein